MDNQNKKLQKELASGLKWSVLEKLLSQVVASIVSILLARILDPEHYGVVAIVTIFTTLCNTIVTSGLSTALVTKKDSDELDFDSAGVANFVMSAILYVVLFFTAPFIAVMYEAPELTALIRVMGLMLPFSAVSSVQHSYMQKTFRFKTYFWGTFVSTIASGAAGLILALNGAGVWALAVLHTSKIVVDAVVLLFICAWKPKLRFSFERVRQMLPFGIKVLITSVIMNIESDIRGLIIGKKFSKTDLAYYNNGMTYPKLVYMVFGNAITKVMLPAFSKIQDDLQEIRRLISRSFQLGAYFITPVMMGLIAVAPTFVLAVFTEKWIQSVPYIQIFSLAFMFMPFENCSKECILSQGKSGWILFDMCFTKGTLFIGSIFSAFVLESVIMIAVFGIISTAISLILYSVQIKKAVGYSIRSILRDLSPSYIISAVMGVCAYFLGFLPISNVFVLLIVQIFGGAAVYLLLSAIFKPYGYKYIVGEITKKLKK